MDAFLRELTSTSGIVLAIDLALLLLLRVLMPSPSWRAIIRLPLVTMALGVALMLAYSQLPVTALRVSALFFLLVALGRTGFLFVFDCLFRGRIVRPLPKILREIIQALIYSLVALIALKQAGVDPTSLLTTSALLTAIIGLSLQDTLGNLFAGLAIQAELPFAIGDWIRFDDERERIGKVVEINWRATKLLTLEQISVVVPNNVLAKAPLMNFSKPSDISMQSVIVLAPHHVTPERVRCVVLDSLAGVQGLVTSPPPTVITADFTERGVKYWVRFFINDFAARHLICSEVRDRVWYAMQRAEIEIPVPHHDVRVFEQSQAERARVRDHEKASRTLALRGIELLRVLPEPLIDRLAELVHARLYTHDEIVFEKGERGDELFIVQRGEVAVLLRHPGGQVSELTRLGEGKFFGEMALLSHAQDSRRSTTIKTTRETTLIVIGRAALQQIVEQSPSLAKTLNDALLDRQRQLEALHEEAEAMPSESLHDGHGQFFDRIREFFSI